MHLQQKPEILSDVATGSEALVISENIINKVEHNFA